MSKPENIALEEPTIDEWVGLAWADDQTITIGSPVYFEDRIVGHVSKVNEDGFSFALADTITDTFNELLERAKK